MKLTAWKQSLFKTTLFLSWCVAQTAHADLMDDYQVMIKEAVHLSEQDKLKRVNDFFNQVPYMSDNAHWGRDDFWATPTQLLTSRGGDCEDYAIAKYLTLLKLGIASEKLQIAHVKLLGRNTKPLPNLVVNNLSPSAEQRFDADESHMVLAYQANNSDDIWLLDNVNGQMLTASQRPDILPVYSFGNNGMWLLKGWDAKYLLSNTMRPPQWVELQSRLN